MFKGRLAFFRQDVQRISLFIKAIKENEINLVHTHHDLRCCKPEIIAARLAGIPCISHRHGYANYTSFDMFFSRFVASNIYISNDVSGYHISQGESREKANIIHNGIMLSEFEEFHNTDQVRREFGCTSDDRLIGIIGRIDWWKGHEYFLEAVAEVSKQVSNIKCLIIGEMTAASDQNQQYWEKLHLLGKSLDLEEKIIFTGFRSDMPKVISALEVVVHASSEPEPFGLVVIEGMAAGKPVVATAAGGVLDIIEDGVSGLLVPCKDSKAMAMAILEVLSNKKKMRLIGEAARRRIAEKFTVQQQIEAVQKVYDTLLGLE